MIYHRTFTLTQMLRWVHFLNRSCFWQLSKVGAGRQPDKYRSVLELRQRLLLYPPSFCCAQKISHQRNLSLQVHNRFLI